MVAAFDLSDSVGILDQYFPNTSFFTEFERFDRHLEKLKSQGRPVDYISICSPNYLHDAHIRYALRYGAEVICEKPAVLNTWNIDGLIKLEQDYANKVHNIMQLRLHPSIVALKHEIDSAGEGTRYDIDLTYITSRGNWYYASWKGDESKSGGIATNIGIHFFDMLIWIFGKPLETKVNIHTHDRAAGYLKLEKADVSWFLSINYDTLPSDLKENGFRTFRSISVDKKEIEFSDGFTDLHTRSYERIFSGDGFSLAETKPAIALAHEIRNADPIGLAGKYHQLATLPLTTHPFASNKN